MFIKKARYLIPAIALAIALSGCSKVSGPESGANDESDAAERLKENLSVVENAKVGDTVLWGRYEQDNNPDNGKEDISWIVLAEDSGRLLLISEKNLDNKDYHEELMTITWESCSLRGWLNMSFLDEAFTAEEQAYIQLTKIENDVNPLYGTDGGNPTDDRVFLLSADEAFVLFEDETTRIAANTLYAVAQGASDTGGNGWWWLRTPGEYGNDAVTVSKSGEIRDDGTPVYDKYHDGLYKGAVRPALWLYVMGRPETESAWSGDALVTNDFSSADRAKAAALKNAMAAMDRVIRLLEILVADFLDELNWYEGVPIATDEALFALVELEETDLPDLGLEEYQSESKMAVNLTEINSELRAMLPDLTYNVNKAYFPTGSNAEWESQIIKSRQLLETAGKHVKNYKEIKVGIEKGNIN